MNRFSVGAVGKKVQIGNLAPKPSLSSREALELAAWLVAAAVPLESGTVGQALDRFHTMLANAAGEGDNPELEAAANEQIDE